MAERVGKAEVLNAFAALCRVFKKTQGYKKGQWFLDHNTANGGYVVCEYEPTGGQSRPLGMRRRKARQFVDCANFLLDGVTLLERQKRLK